MKVVAEEDAERPARPQARNCGCDGQHLLMIGRKCDHRFDGLHHLCHALQLRCRHENGLCCKEERAPLSNHLRKTWLAQLRIEGTRQSRLVETEAEARTVEQLDDAGWRLEFRKWQDSVHDIVCDHGVQQGVFVNRHISWPNGTSS